MPKGDGADPFSGLHCRFRTIESLPHTIPAEVLALPADGDKVVAVGTAGSVVVLTTKTNDMKIGNIFLATRIDFSSA